MWRCQIGQSAWSLPRRKGTVMKAQVRQIDRTSYNKWWYRTDRSPLLYSLHRAGTKAHAWPAVCPVI